MKNRFSTRGKRTVWLYAALVACGLTWSCSDDFKYDDEKPSWLNTSIYEGLEERGNFSTYLRLLSDPAVNEEGVSDLKEVLSRTGSKTVFVANDEAWQTFFDHNRTLPVTNPWHNATSYENLSESQKLLLIHTSMLNNAIVMENLASSDGSQQASPTRGEYMRRYTDYVVTDTITYLSPEELPYSYNELDDDYWGRFRAAGKRNNSNYAGIYVVNDSTANMMLHFTSEHMTKQNVSDGDFAIFMGRERATSDVHIYDALLQEKDIVAENGYVNITEKVLAPLPNMAEVIRTNGMTNIFSHMMDRFSFPAYNRAVTIAYNRLHIGAEVDSIFTKKYFSLLAANAPKGITTDPDGKEFKDGQTALKYDPGWNEYSNEYNVRADMAAMFVPNDDAMWEYFSTGGGKQLIQTYAPNPDAEIAKGDFDALYHQIDAIPLGTLQALINNLMKESFVESVPSKMTGLRNDAQEDMFTAEDVQQIDTCLLACNGAVYVMNHVYLPADYTSVAAPAYITKTNLIMKWAIYNGSNENNDQMGLNYYAYLKAMRSRFTFFLPSDEAMLRYYDPVSFTSTKPRVVSLTFTGKDDNWSLTKNAYKLYSYDVATGTQGSLWGNETMLPADIANRLKDILESHTIVHDGTNPIDSEDEYYIAKNGAALKVTRDANGAIVGVQGGFQLENERAGIVNGSQGTLSIGVTAENTFNLDNGRTYVIDDCPIIPASKSVYNIMSTTTDEAGNMAFEEFYDLTLTPAEVDKVITACGLVNSEMQASDQERVLKKYKTFIQDNTTGGVDQNVQFFNNYRYTVFVPNNEAMAEAIAHGLPTWTSIMEDYESLPVDEKENPILTAEDSLRLQAKITYLNNFIRGHFLDNSIFADKSEVPTTEFVTSSYNSDLGLFVKVHVRRVKSGGETQLLVRDDNGGQEYRVTDVRNIMARDVTCMLTDDSGKTTMSPTGRRTMNGITIQGSSFAVLHQINGVLNHTPLIDSDGDGVANDYGINWNSPTACKRYLQKFAIR